MLKVIKPGLFSTIQDAGRTGYQQYGVIVSGAMDSVAFRIGNALLKQHNRAAIEMTLVGGIFEFQIPTAIVLAGGQMQATVNEVPVPMYKVISIEQGDILKCGTIHNGARSYLCIAGGFSVEEILGSRSTYIKAAFGGFHGRTLQANDSIPYTGTASPYHTYQVISDRFYEQKPIRLLKGTEWEHFSHLMQQRFIEQHYMISLEADRMGYRLEGQTVISLEKPFNLLSEAVTFGTVQLPPSGQPILLMADRQTTGGYPKIAQIITADLHKVAQLGPKQPLHFELVTIEQAEQAYFQLEQRLRLLETLLRN
ncbi:biotin-dependent carboxyltransferase family protein [Solibacillus sp. FSL W7-1464]|uniref:5-oxoprolinase subunit C family protein n=1 Tax=Solibacillus sp. FSL W7-1464 TaxID=2921706 RepID=UPI0030F7D2BA